MVDVVFDEGWGYILKCDQMSSVQRVQLQYGGYWLEMMPEDFLVELGNGMCTLCMFKSGIE